MAKKTKQRTAFVCQSCGASATRWMGRCVVCGEWNTLVEERTSSGATSARAELAGGRVRAQRIADVSPEDARRLPTGIGELDRALGGGPVAGGVILLGGDPGIGKSTLLMQALGGLAAQGHRSLYVSGEESAAQVAMRAARIAGPSVDDVMVLASTALEEVEASIKELNPSVVVLDSVQTVRSGDLESAPGSVGQVREVSSRLVDSAKVKGFTLFLIGHVTKQGALAGPKVLEHLVDTVLSFEGDHTMAFRVVRATKNRFGPANELGVFEMNAEGLSEVQDASSHLLRERPGDTPGSAVTPTANGSRPLMVEVQALVSPAVYGSGRRVVAGVESNRLAILLAVLERKAGLQVLDSDVFVSLAGGVRVEERSMDLAIASAIASSLRERAIPSGYTVFGEVGLTGELRAVPRPGLRISEAKKLGFADIVLPKSNVSRLTDHEREGVTLHPAETLEAALDHLFR